jgi:hypothetical protein
MDYFNDNWGTKTSGAAVTNGTSVSWIYEFSVFYQEVLDLCVYILHVFPALNMSD